MKRIHSLFLIHGKPSKKSKLTYRVRNGRQQCYHLNHRTPDSPKQRACQSLFGKVSAIVNREFKSPVRIAFWEDVAAQSITPNYTARKAAYAHFASQIKAEAQVQTKTQTISSPPIKSPEPQCPSPLIIAQLNQFLMLFAASNFINITENQSCIKKTRSLFP